MTITPREFDFQAARRRLEAKTKSAGDKLTSLDVAVARVKDGGKSEPKSSGGDSGDSGGSAV